MPVLQRFLYQLGMAKESTQFTYVAPSTADQFFPVYNPKITTVIDPILDEGFRSLASKDFALNQGFRYSRLTCEFQPQPQDIGTIFKALLGGTDTVTGAGPFLHSIPQLNTGLPPTYSLALYDATAATSRVITGAYLESVKLDYTSTGMLKCAVSFAGKYETTQTKPVAVYDAVQPFTPWMNAATINASTTVGARLIGLAWEAKRPFEGIWGAGGTQDLTSSNVGPIECSATLTMYIIDATDFALYTGNTQGQFQLKFASGTNPILQINHQLAAFENGTVIEATKEYLILTAKARALYNSTDVGTLALALTNNKTTAY